MNGGAVMTKTRSLGLQAGTRGAPPSLRGLPDRVVHRDREVIVDPRDDRPEKEARDRAETLAVALAQPHRKGSDDKRLATALGRFCLLHKPAPLGAHCWLAGERYAEIVREAKNAQGFNVPGRGAGDGVYETLSDKELAAKKELALMRLKEAETILRAVLPRLPRAMERLTHDDLDPSPYDGAVLVHGLVALAGEWGFAPRRFGD